MIAPNGKKIKFVGRTMTKLLAQEVEDLKAIISNRGGQANVLGNTGVSANTVKRILFENEGKCELHVAMRLRDYLKTVNELKTKMDRGHS